MTPDNTSSRTKPKSRAKRNIMFTGIIETLGTITGIRPSGAGKQLEIRSDIALAGTKIGDSIAVNGACLTAVAISGSRFAVDVSPETLTRSTLGGTNPGSRVNLERAMMLSGRLDGHLVSGHIDGTGRIRYIKDLGRVLVVGISVPETLTRYLIEKGSVAVDGISLTINTCDKEGFEVTVIPHTAKITTIGFRNPGDRVNIETDMIGKYVEKFVRGKAPTEKGRATGSAIDMDMLTKTGFL